MNRHAHLILLCCFLFLYFSPALHFFFVTDDFIYTHVVSLKETYMIRPWFYHYSPIFWFVMYCMHGLFGMDAFGYHAITLLTHGINVFLVYCLGKQLYQPRKPALLSAMLFALFFSHYEVVYWITGLDTSLMTMWYLGAFLLYLNYLRSKRLMDYCGFFLLFVLAFFTHEFAVTLPLILLIYEYVISSSVSRLLVLKKLSPPLFVIAIFIFGKKIVYHTPLTVFSPTPLRIIQSVIKSTVYLLLPFPDLLDSAAKPFLILLFGILLIIGVYSIRIKKLHLLFIIWILVHILLFSITSLPQARYFYLSTVPASLLITSMLGIHRDRLYSLRWSIKLGIFLVLFSANISFLTKQMMYWRQTSQIIRDSVTRIHADPEVKKADRVVLLNMPDSINGPPWNAYLFRSGFDRALGMEPERVRFARTIPASEILRDDPLIQQSEIDELHKLHIPVYSFDFLKKELKRK